MSLTMCLNHLFFHSLQRLLVRPILDWSQGTHRLTLIWSPTSLCLPFHMCISLPLDFPTKAMLLPSSTSLIVCHRQYELSFLIVSLPLTPLHIVSQRFLLSGAYSAFSRGLWQACRLPASLLPSSVQPYVLQLSNDSNDSLPGLSAYVFG